MTAMPLRPSPRSTRPIARKALKLIKVDYEILPHVTDVDEAMKPNAPVMHNDIFTEGVEPKPTKPSNVASAPSSAMAMSKRASRRPTSSSSTATRPRQTHQGYIEPHACLANVGPDGQGELWVCTQGHFMFRNLCAALLGMDISKLRVTASEIGGGFGGKTHVWIEPIGAGAVAQGQPSGEARHEPRGSVPRLRPDLLHLDRREDRRHEGRHASPPPMATLRYQGGAFAGSPGPSSAP